MKKFTIALLPIVAIITVIVVFKINDMTFLKPDLQSNVDYVKEWTKLKETNRYSDDDKIYIIDDGNKNVAIVSKDGFEYYKNCVYYDLDYKPIISDYDQYGIFKITAEKKYLIYFVKYNKVDDESYNYTSYDDSVFDVLSIEWTKNEENEFSAIFDQCFAYYIKENVYNDTSFVFNFDKVKEIYANYLDSNAPDINDTSFNAFIYFSYYNNGERFEEWITSNPEILENIQEVTEQ